MVELNRELVVPRAGLLRVSAVLQAHFAAGILRDADVDDETAGDRLAGVGVDFLQHEAAQFGLHRVVGGRGRAAERDRDLVIALRLGDGEIKRLVRAKRVGADSDRQCARFEAIAGFLCIGSWPG